MSRPNTGGLRAIGDNMWELSVSLGADPATGRYRRRTRTYRGTERQALAELKKWRRDLLTVDTGPTDMTLGWVIAEHLDQLAIEGRSPSTLGEYRRLVRDHIPTPLTQLPVGELGVNHLDRLYRNLTARGLSASSVRHVNAVISGALTRAGRKGWLGQQPVNVARYATKPAKPSRRVRAPQTDSVRALYRAALVDETPERALCIRLLAETGVRRGEVCGFRWADLDGTSIAVVRNVVAVGPDHDAGVQASTNKTSKSARSRRVIVKALKVDRPRRIALSPDLLLALAVHRGRMEQRAEIFEMTLAGGAFVFSDDPDQARPWYPPIVSEFVGRLRRNHGIDEPRILHGLRHHAATEMLANGIDPAVGAERLGHSSTKMFLDIYADARPARDQAAADLLGEIFRGE